MSLEALINVAIVSLFTGVGTGAGVGLGTWVISRSVINQFEKIKEREAKSEEDRNIKR